MIYIEEVFGRRCTESIDLISPVDILILVKIRRTKRKAESDVGRDGLEVIW